MEQSSDHIFPVENALEMIIMFNRAGEISYANAAALQKLEYDNDLCGRTIGDVFPGAFGAGNEGFEQRASDSQELKNLVAYRKNMTCFPVEARIIYTPSSGMYICMANDILQKEFLSREVERVREEAQQALKVKSEFVANITHELRTPVNGILGNVREMLTEKADERTEFVLEPRRFHFRNMLDYVKGHHINKITEKGLGFFMTVSPQIPEYVIGDELRIVQVLNNLLSNALKFTSLGKISVEIVKTAQVNDKIELFFIVSDTGIGIDKADRDKLFQSFSQVDASISRKYGGTGLGLNICKQLVELMGGSIEVESEKDRGSNFSFSIWVGACESEEGVLTQETFQKPAFTASFAADREQEDVLNIKRFGTPENLDNLNRNLSKLILCVEMENWEKAEMFMETVRQLTEEAPQELKMAIQKENYEKVTAGYEELKNCL